MPRVTQILQHVYWVRYKTQRSLAEAFLRFEEHYESPNKKFRTAPFTLAEFKKWYKNRYGSFTYYKDWAGFNLPGRVVQAVAKFEGLSKAEREFIKLVQHLPLDSCYIIGTSDDNGNEALDHEISHGMFCTDEEYRRNVLDILHRFHTVLLPVFSYVSKKSKYAPSVAHDEVHAYVMFDRETLATDGINVEKLSAVSDTLYANYHVFKRRNSV